MQFVDLKRQYQLYKKEIDARIHAVLDSSCYILGPEVTELEQKLAEFVGVKHAICVSSGTDSLLFALMALGVGPGDEVITTPFTWISTAEVVSMLGAKPVFVDIEEESYNIDPTLIESAITERTKAILPVNLFGQVANLEAIEAIAKRYNLPVIEDGAQSFGATRHGRQSCGLTLIGSTSFFPAKAFGCYGDGGALFTNDDWLAQRMRTISVHGGEPRDHHICIGLNGRFDTIQAAVLLAKLPHFEAEVAIRQRIGARYSEALEEVCGVPRLSEGNSSVYAPYTIRSSERDRLRQELLERGVPTAVYYPKPLHLQPVFESLGYGPGSFPVTERAAAEVVSLPLHPWLTEEEQELVIGSVLESAALVGV